MFNYFEAQGTTHEISVAKGLASLGSPCHLDAKLDNACTYSLLAIQPQVLARLGVVVWFGHLTHEPYPTTMRSGTLVHIYMI